MSKEKSPYQHGWEHGITHDVYRIDDTEYIPTLTPEQKEDYIRGLCDGREYDDDFYNAYHRCAICGGHPGIIRFEGKIMSMECGHRIYIIDHVTHGYF